MISRTHGKLFYILLLFSLQVAVGRQESDLVQTNARRHLLERFLFVRLFFLCSLRVCLYFSTDARRRDARARQLSQQHQRQSARNKKSDSDEMFSRVDSNDWSYVRSRAPIEIALTSDGSVLADYNGEGERERKKLER